MRQDSGRSSRQPVSSYECLRCGEAFACETQDDLFRVTTHRLLHLAVDWGPCFQWRTHWIRDEDGPRPVLG